MKVAVVGAGIVGASAALVLAEQGAEVVVLERGDVAGEASGLNAGIIGGGGWGDTPDLEVTLKMGSREMFVDLSENGYDIGLDLTGTLTLIRTEDEWDWAVAAVTADTAAGRNLELIDQGELQELEPAADPQLLGAILDPDGARAEPVAATYALAARARQAGADFQTRTAVTSLRQLPNGWAISAEGRSEDLGADAVVLSAGPWCAELGAMVGATIPIVPVRGQMWASEAQAPLLRHAITAAESPLAWSQDRSSASEPPNLTHSQGQRITRHLYGRQRPNGEIVFGGDRVMSPDRTLDPNGINVNHEHVGELLPPTRELATARTWAGLMPFSLDGQPLIGPVPERPGLFVAGGLASSGFGRGPMTGRLVADLVAGNRPPVPPPPNDGRITLQE